MSSMALLRWLDGDASALIRIVPARHAGDPRPLGLSDGLARWRGRIERRRAIALARRWLILALLFAVAVELIAAAAGAAHRGLWLLPIALPALIAVAAVTRRRVGAVEATLLLDRQLGLSERLTTALELSSGSSARSPLAPLLLGEAESAIDESLARSRASDPSAPREWLCALVAGTLLVGAIALGAGHGASRSVAHAIAGSSSHNTSTRAGAAAGTTGRPPASTSTARKAAAPRAGKLGAASRPASAGHATRTTTSRAANGHASATGTTGASAGARAGHATGSSGGSSARVPAGEGKGGVASVQGTTKAGATARGREGSAATPGGATRRGAAPGAGTAGRGATTHASTPAAGTAAAAGKARSTSDAGAGRSGRTTGAAATPGSKAAGTARGRIGLHAGHGTSSLAAVPAKLPIRTGYGAAHGNRSSAQALGEGKAGAGGKASQGESSATGETVSAASFAFIPFTPQQESSSQAPLLRSYFGPFAALSGLSW
jgi:hypothetical protein